ncbi:MAG: ribonuclease [Chlamydiales bacterium]|jgi:ribonuclease G|nr:ribonuclease [Chlamydiales bacterium]
MAEIVQEILLNIESKQIRYAHLKNGQLQDLIVELKRERQLTGNIYKGRVINSLRDIKSAFIDINEEENGFIHISDIIENTKKFEEMFDMDFDLDYDIKRVDTDKQIVDIDQVMKIGQAVLVQVVKDPIGSKGARLTSNISIAGRYLVLLPNTPHRGVSRKIEDRAVRLRLRKMIRGLEMPQQMGIICRTASQHATLEMLVDEANDLLNTWHSVMDRFHKADGVECLYQESDLVRRAALTCVNKKYTRLLVDDYAVYQTCKSIYAKYEQEHTLQIEYYRDKVPMFERFQVEREIDKALRRKIWLPSGGYLYFDPTEAMCTIDVNSGRGSSDSKEKVVVEESLVKINLEAVEEIARQLRIRNIGGLIVCDFIDMRSKKNQKRVLEKLKDCMKEDSAKCTILGMSEFGLVEMTRQRNRKSLMQTMYTDCLYCGGCGQIKAHETTSIEIERALKKAINLHQQYGLRLVVHPELDRHLAVIDKEYFKDLMQRWNAHIEFATDDNLHLNEYHIISTSNGKKIEV